MRSDLTDITLVVDRSGSMDVIKEDAEGGVNAFIKKQADEPGEALLTLVQFDTEYDFVHKGAPIDKVPHYDLYPRGATALLDAVGRAINETGERLAAMNEQDRPGLVILVVMTDGFENSSKEFTNVKIREMIERQQNKYDWHFTFLGANQDAFAEAGAMGMDLGGTANFSPEKMGLTFSVTGGKVARMRKQSRDGETVDNAFTEQERGQMT